MMSHTSTRGPECQVNCQLPAFDCFKNDFWASEASNLLGSFGLGSIFNHTEAVH